jgi:sigma-B regulation protein RsbU (phosphoserine phosphatase)
VYIDQIVQILVDLIDEMSVMVTVIAIVVSSIKPFKELVVEEKFTYKNQIIMILIFGFFSIFGNYSGTKLSSGAIANIRDIGPLIAGLVGGPVIGIGAGLIGGINRYFAGGSQLFLVLWPRYQQELLGGRCIRSTKGSL